MKHLGGRKVQTRFLAAFLLVAIVPLGVFAALVYSRTRATLRDVERAEISGLATGVKEVLRSSIADQNRFVEDYAVWDGFYFAVKARNVGWLADNATVWVPSSSHTKLVHVFTLDGTTVAHGGHPAPPGLWRIDEVQRASRGGVKGGAHGDLEAFNGRLYVLAAAPITRSTETMTKRPAGVLVFARPVTDKMLAEINRFTGGAGNLAVFTDGRPSASTADTQEWSASPADVIDHAPGAAYVEGGFTSQIIAIPDGEGAQVSLLKVSVPRATFADALKQINTITIVALLGAVALVLATGLLMARTITRPLGRLADAAGAMSAGELRQRLDVSRRDEFGLLAQAFNAMSEQVAERVDHLSQKTQSLALEISALGSFGATLAQTPDADVELLRLAEMIRIMVDGDSAGIYLAEDDGLQLAAFSGAAKTPAPPSAMAELAAQAAHGGALEVNDASTDDSLSQKARSAGGLRSALAAPLTQRDGTAGALVVGYADVREVGPEALAMLTTVAGQIAIALQNGQAYKKLDAMYLETVTALAAAMEAKDQYTASHADSLASMAIEVGRRLQMNDADLRMLQYAAVLHDIGKIGVPGSILNKPDKLTAEEFAVMAEHTVIGERIISHIDYLMPIAGMIRSAHERWDGNGYPDKLAAEQIPLASRILLVCDAFDAMTTDRPYRGALPVQVALDEIRTNAGSQFDPDVVEVFLEGYPFEDEPPERRAPEGVLATATVSG